MDLTKKMFTKILVYCFLQFQFVLKVDGVTLTLNPPSMMIGSSTGNPTQSLIVQCASSETDINIFVLLKISRRKFTESTFTGVASLLSTGVYSYDQTAPPDIKGRSNLTGSVDTEKKGTMTLSINAQGLTCTDQAEFNCSFSYIDTTGNTNLQTFTDNKNFTVTTVPSEVIIDSPEYYGDNGNTLQLNNNSVLNAGTRIKYRCTANVGSVPEGEIIWERSSELGSMYSFIPYTSAQSTDIVQESSQQNGCFYRRTSTMYYNLTKMDEDGISFRCRARSYLGGQLYEALSNQQYRVVAAPSSGTSKQVAVAETPAQAGMIAGAVIGSIAGVVLIIVLIYFLWYRRRSSGESYRTKEEGERPEPPPTDYTYSMPEKKKMDGYDNKGLEEPQEKTTRYPRSGRGGFDAREGRNGRGHHNPGMDDEDGGTMHMSGGPIGTGV